jgi:GNAT superfamily N-acetyltransferase
MIVALEKFLKQTDPLQYPVKYIDIKNPKIFTKETRLAIEKLLLQLIDFHSDIMGREFRLLGINEEMPRDIEWEWYEKHANVYCLYDGDTIVGVCTCRTHKTGRRAKNTCYIMELILEKKYRGRGLGSYLLNSAVQDCKKHEPYINVVMLDVYDENSSSMKAYQNSGFKAFSHAMYKPVK